MLLEPLRVAIGVEAVAHDTKGLIVASGVHAPKLL